MSTIAVFKRRGFLKGITGGAGLLLGCTLPEVLKLSGQDHPRTVERGPKNPNAFIHISPNNTVTFIVTKPEMGQGTATALPMLLAEELDCDWNKIQTEFAPVDPGSYGMQGVYGSSSIRQSWRPLRQIGATARAMLIEAASQKWNVDKNQIRTEDGWLIGPGNTGRLSYGSVAEAAAKLPVASEVPLKSPKNFRLIGTPIKRLDTRTKVNGSAKFGIDARVPGMQYAVLAHCPVFGGKVVSFDASMAKAIPGVKAIVQVSNGVAVVADNTWTAMEARKALAIQWDEGANSGQSSASIRKMFADLADRPGALAKKTGDSSQALACAAKKVDAVYEAPFLAHAPMEPINCTAVVRPDSSEIWAATQAPTATRESAAKITGLAPEKIKVNTLFVGGGFGRRSNVDYVADAVEIAKAVPGVPVKLTWTREDDIERGPYRPGAYVKFASGLDSDGWPTSLAARVASPSFFGGRGGDKADPLAVERISTVEYAIPHMLVEHGRAETGIPTFFWRSVGYSQNTFFAESFLDELAAAGGKDPVELRRRLLANSPRQLAVLNRVAEKADWGRPQPGRFQGVALVNNVGSFTAQVAEISINAGKLKIHRVVCAVDCGQVVNPALVRQQMEGGIVYGLSAMKGAITFERGRPQQGNFDKYDVLRIDEMPEVVVEVVNSDNPPGGIGEAAVPPIAPAVCNAIFAATGKRVRRLPLLPQDLA